MIVSMSEDDFDSVLRVHLKGTFAATKFACIRWRERSKAGQSIRAAIVNTVSSAGLQGNVGRANYGSAKAGIAALTIITSLEGSRYGVRANAVAPGGVTRLTGGVVKDMEPDEYGDEEFSRLNPRNSAPMVAWLASDQWDTADIAAEINAQVFHSRHPGLKLGG